MFTAFELFFQKYPKSGEYGKGAAGRAQTPTEAARETRLQLMWGVRASGRNQGKSPLTLNIPTLPISRDVKRVKADSPLGLLHACSSCI